MFSKTQFLGTLPCSRCQQWAFPPPTLLLLTGRLQQLWNYALPSSKPHWTSSVCFVSARKTTPRSSQQISMQVSEFLHAPVPIWKEKKDYRGWPSVIIASCLYLRMLLDTPEGAGCGEMGLLSKKWGNGFGEGTKIATQGRAPNHQDNAII